MPWNDTRYDVAQLRTPHQGREAGRQGPQNIEHRMYFISLKMYTVPLRRLDWAADINPSVGPSKLQSDIDQPTSWKAVSI